VRPGYCLPDIVEKGCKPHFQMVAGEPHRMREVRDQVHRSCGSLFVQCHGSGRAQEEYLQESGIFSMARKPMDGFSEVSIFMSSSRMRSGETLSSCFLHSFRAASRPGFQRESELAGKPAGPQESESILFKTDSGITNGTDAFFFDVAFPVMGIDEQTGSDVDGHGVDGKIPAGEILVDVAGIDYFVRPSSITVV
jgi:hypothetical protein